MSYEAKAAEAGAEPIRIVEIDFDTCQHAYGIAPCAAAIGVTGADKCYNTFQTCQDKANYSKTVKTLRFWPVKRPMQKGFDGLPFLQSASIAATQLDPDHGLGPRGKVTVTFRETVDNDALTDPYFAERAYDTTAGSFFGKLKARNGQALVGRTIRVREGFVADPWDWSLFRDHTYLIDDFEGPDDRGTFTIKAIDPLDRAKKKLYPAPSQAPLTADVSSIADTLNLTDVRGTITEDDGLIAIGDEIMAYASRVEEANGSLTLGGLTRGQWGTAADDHAQGDNVQQCAAFVEQKVVDVLYPLYQAGDMDEFVTLSDWLDVQNQWRRTIRFTHVIAKPTEIYKLIKQVAEQAGMFQWWDELSQRVKLDAIAPALLNELPPVLTEQDVIIAKSLRINEGQRGQLTRIIVNYLPYNRIDLSDPKDYSARFAYVNFEVESENAFNRIIEQEVFAPWLRTDTDAEALAVRKSARRSLGDNRIAFKIDKKDKHVCEVGAVVAIEHPYIQTVTGAKKRVNVRIRQADPINDHQINIEATTSTYQSGIDPDERIMVWQDNDVRLLDYDSATEEQRLRGFYADDNGIVPTGGNPYRYY